MIIDELLVKLGFTGDIKKIHSFTTGLEKARKAAFIFTSVINVAGAAVSGFIGKTLIGVDETAKFSHQVGLSVEQLQELQFATNRVGGSNRDLGRSLRGLNKAISEARDGMGTAVEVFGRLGVSTTSGGKIRSTVDILEDLSEKIKDLPVAQQTDFAESLGISRSTLLLMQQGKLGIESLRKEADSLGIVTTEQAKKAEEFADALRNVRQIGGTLIKSIAVGLAPALTETLKSFSDWVIVNRKFIQQGMTTIIKDLVNVFVFFSRILGDIFKLFERVTKAAGGFNNILQLIAIGGVIFGIAKLIPILREIKIAFSLAKIQALLFDAAAALLPALVIAAFALLVLAVQDFITWLRGGRSEFGLFIETLKSFKKWMDSLFDALIEKALKLGSSIASGLKSTMVAVKAAILAPVKAVEHAFSKMLESAKGAINSVIRLANKVPGVNIHQFSTATTAPPRMTSAQQAAVTAQTVNNAGSITTTSASNNITVNVNGTQDPGAVAQQVVNHINEASRQAHRNNASAIAI